ncbi:hypothetical protein OO015_09890 [Thermomicrobium sp. 4228-Ro]|uniref:right-handed parallel beta-helix repeat-containing protein n=1 Tax=Thermomicrobium sp. 4228-Ro TaxID=2993937 RepID=UPI002248F1F7|nr:right-handed parallel beta-helix repeat-containing protein [Thermomicrobium sp. 4228-Ro]MCX2727797.1 hypothetical protein [Thermomicrobium sp. 4228-Ro]
MHWKGLQVTLLVGSLALAAVGGALVFASPIGAAEVTISVTGTSDGTGACSGSGASLTCPTLRAAVLAANDLTEPVTIDLAAGSYRLDIPPATDDTAETGDLDITKRGGALTVRGQGSSQTAIAGGWAGEADRLFDVGPGATVVLDGVRLTGGQAVHDDARDHDGGAIWVGGVLQLGEVAFEGNHAAADGGAIYVAPSGTVTTLTGARVTFRENTAGESGEDGTPGKGGALAVAGTVVLDGTVAFTGNSATETGGAVHVAGGRVVLGSRVVIGGTADGAANQAGTDGGGLALDGGQVELQGTLVQGNRVPTDVTEGDSGRGGGIWVAKGLLTLRNAVVAGNRASNGGGIATDQGRLTALDSEIRDNRATHGGGGIAVVGAGNVEVVGGTIAGNVAENGDGGGIANAGTVALSRTVIENNLAEAGSGGGIANDGTLDLSSPDTVIVRNNRARLGGGIASIGSGRLRSLIVQGNLATQDGGGIWSRGELVLEGATIEGNRSQAAGGGIYHEGSKALTLLGGTVVRNNQAVLDGGGIVGLGKVILTSVTIEANSTSGSGGGVVAAAQADLQRVQLIDNQAVNDAGGLLVLETGKVTVTDTAVRRSTAGQLGGGIVVRNGGQLTMSASSITENQASSYGGGIAVLGTAAFTNVTVSTNVSQQRGGGLWVGPQGTATLSFVTIASNAAAAGGALYNDGGTVTVQGTLIAASPGGGNCGGLAPGSLGTNLEDRDSCLLRREGDLVNAMAGLQPLQVDPAGGTLFHALGLGSPAVDAAGTQKCPKEDQLHVERPQGPACDIGAYEYPVPQVTPMPTAGPTSTAVSATPTARPVTPTPALGVGSPIVAPRATPTPTIGLPATGTSGDGSGQRALGFGLVVIGLAGAMLGGVGLVRSNRRTEREPE